MAGLADFLKNKIFGTTLPPVQEAGGQPIKVIEVGSPGTENYAGYINEEYLSDLSGTRWADLVDKMRRSDPNVRLCLNAVKLPLKSSNWTLQTKDNSQMAEMQKKLLTKALFVDTGKSWKKLISEVLTAFEYGYSLFEITHCAKFDDEEMGPYNTLKSIGFRSQRTIERWNVDSDGRLISVTQISNGDEGRIAEMDARFLLHFSFEQEGNNYEGISALRPMYGNWLRKNQFLKLLASALEKYAIPTPILEVPSGMENSEEISNAEAALQAYTSNQKNYIMKPVGWSLTVEKVTVDTEKIRETINFENQEMVNSILASFLMLGQGENSGNRALGGTLKDFFAQSIIFMGDIISEQFQNKVMEPLVKMNFGNVPLLVDLKCDNLAEKADKAFAETVGVLLNSGAVKNDRPLEEFLREKFKLTKIDEETRVETPPQQPQFPGGPAQFSELAEKKSPPKRQREASALIKDSSGTLKAIFKRNLKLLSVDLINKVMKEKAALPSSKQSMAAVNVPAPESEAYSQRVQLELTKIMVEARSQVLGLAGKKGKKLAEFRLAQDRQSRIRSKTREIESLEAELDNMAVAYASNPTDKLNYSKIKTIQDKISSLSREARALIEEENGLDFEDKKTVQAKAQSILDVQMQDLRKQVVLQYGSSYPSTDSDEVLRKDLSSKADEFVGGPVSNTGPDILASQTVNEGRLSAAEEIQEKSEDEVESYTFVAVDDDRTTEICSELNGRTFAANDPDVDKYSPPLHHNCRSYLAVNLKSFKENPQITEEELKLSKAAQGSITLSETTKIELLGQRGF